MADRIARAGQALNLTAADVAAEVGLTLPEGQVWELDMARSTAPAGVTIEWDRVHGIVEDGWHGTATLVVFWASDGQYHDVTEYVIEVPAEGVTPQDVADFLGRGDDPQTVAAARETLPIVSAMARSYTRDRGFVGSVPAEDLRAVLVTASARLMANPEQLQTRVGEISVAGWQGWTLAELFVLNRYRVRAL